MKIYPKLNKYEHEIISEIANYDIIQIPIKMLIENQNIRSAIQSLLQKGLIKGHNINCYLFQSQIYLINDIHCKDNKL